MATTAQRKEMEECRKDFEDHVRLCIKEHAREEFLKVGSEHWLDFKAGWMAAHVPSFKRRGDPE